MNSTLVVGANVGRTETWRVYRIRTANSVYELEVESESPHKARRVAVLTCLVPEHRRGESHEDSSPKVGGESLYCLSPLEWIGKCLTVGTVRTSELTAVDFISHATARRLGARPLGFAAPAQAPAPAEPPPWAPFPLGSVEMAEAAASLLRAVCHRHDLSGALSHEPAQKRRLQLALAQCGLMLEALSGR